MNAINLQQTDITMDLGSRVLVLIAAGYDGVQISQIVNESPERAMEALVNYAHRVLHGTAPKAQPSSECGVPTHNGWCYTHGVFHMP